MISIIPLAAWARRCRRIHIVEEGFARDKFPSTAALLQPEITNTLFIYIVLRNVFINEKLSINM